MAMKNLVQVGPSSLGAAGTTTGQGDLRARLFLSSARYKLLDRRAQYYECTQHDYKQYDFDGRMRVPGEGGIAVHQPLLDNASAPHYVPLKLRRPSSPYRLPRVMVNAFTDMVYGEGRFPMLRVEGDADSQDYAQALSRAMRLPVKMIQARNRGGSTGSVALSWCFQKGKPRCRVHNTRDLFVHDWEDREQLIPRKVSEVFQYPNEEWDPRRRCFMQVMYWHRRDWTLNEDILFEPLRVEPGKEPGIDQEWLPDLRRSMTHDDGVAHIEWIQNLPSDDPDGVPDYEGLYENFDSLDMLVSVITRGAILNLDPTVKLKMDPEILARTTMRKGSDNALVVGETGDAEYMELGGTSITAGIELFNSNRRSALEVGQCVVPDPSEIAAAGTSSVAIKVIYQPMLGKCDVIREQYAGGMERMLANMLHVAQRSTTAVYYRYRDDGSTEKVQYVIDLPPKVTSEAIEDEEGNPTGEESITIEERVPGSGEEVQSQWGPYFPPTPTDQQLVVTTLTTATGQQPIMSQQTAVEIAMTMYNRPPEEEHARLAKEQEKVKADQAQMFADSMGDAGGQVDGPGKFPPGATGRGKFFGPKKGAPGVGSQWKGDKGQDADEED
jgi:hypothetical protein